MPLNLAPITFKWPQNHKYGHNINKTKQQQTQYYHPEVARVVMQMKMGTCRVMAKLPSS